MKQIEVRFEAAPELEQIEVLIRAPEADGQVAAIQRQLSGLVQETLTVFDANELQRMIPLEDVISASVNGKLVNIVTEDGSYYTRQTLRNLEPMLGTRRFVRISRYEIVNLAKVRRFDFTLAGTLRLELAGGMETWASRRCIPEIRRRLAGEG
jgi:DNA-binding LytR/AlgR family response regulator